jgi:hypothetical protein
VEREYQKLIEQMQLDHDASLASLRMQITALKDAAKAQRVPWAETPNGKKWFCIATIFVIAIFAAWAEGRNSVHRFDLIGQDSAGNTIALYSVSHDTVADHLLSMPHIGDRRTLADGRTFALISGQWALVTPPANTTPKVPARRKVHEPGSKEVLADSAQTE